MNSMKKIIAGFLIFLTAPLILLFFAAFTINATLLNPDTVKGWFSEENIYNESFVAELLTAGIKSDIDKKETAPSLNFTETEVVSAFSATFTPEFVRSQVEGAVDQTHDFASGESKELKLTLSLGKQKGTLTNEFVAILKPKVKKLPICATGVKPSINAGCRPANMTVAAFSKQLASQLLKDAKLYSKPTILLDSEKNEEQQRIAQSIPDTYNGIRWLIFAIPILVVMMLGGVVLLTKPESRIHRLQKATWYILVNTALTLVIALLLIWASRNTDFGLSELFSGKQQLLGGYISSLVQAVVGSMSTTLAIVSGFVSALAIMALVSLSIVRRRHEAEPAIPQIPPMPPPTSGDNIL